MGAARPLWALAGVMVGIRVLVAVAVERGGLRIVPAGGVPLTPSDHPVGRGFFSWDATLYREISQHGYPHAVPTLASFYPLYPMTVRAITTVLPIGYSKAALGVSWGSLFLGTWALLRLSARLLPEHPPWRAGLLLVWFPTSVFLVSGYAEAMFVALVAGALLMLAEERPAAAAALGALASATRPEGVFVGLAILAWYLVRRDGGWLRIVGLVACSEAGFVAWTLFLWHRYGSPVAEIHAQRAWNRQATWPLHTFEWSLRQIAGGHLTGADSANATAVFLLDDATIAAGVVALVLLIRWLRHTSRTSWLAVASAAPLLVAVSNGPFGKSPEAAARLIMCIPALYLVAARLRSELAWTSLLVVFVACAVPFQLLFNLGGWFT